MYKPIARRVLTRFPFKETLVTRGALLPPALKVYPIQRALHVIKQASATQECLLTNLGMNRALRVSLPWEMSDAYFFGRPTDYHGEEAALQLAGALCGHSSAFIDIGSHIGYFIFYLRNVCGSNVPIFFFEPNPDLYNLIVQNVATNWLPDVTGYPFAVGSVSGNATFFLDLSDPLQSSLHDTKKNSHELKAHQVKVVTFDNWMQSKSLSNLCVKVDAENAEFEVIEGARQNLNKISFLIMEILTTALHNHFVDMMIYEHGFQAYYVNHFALQHSPTGTFQHNSSELNWLFCRQSPRQLQALLTNTPFRVN